MTQPSPTSPADPTARRARGSSPWRIAGWSAAALALLVPLVATFLTDEVAWSVADFVFVGVLVLGVGVSLELAVRTMRSPAYRGAVALALLAAVLLVVVNGAVGIVGAEDNDVNLLFGGVLAVAAVGTLAARFRPRGMAGAMAATALAQASVAVGALVAGWTSPGSEAFEIVAQWVFVALWAGSAALFRRAARGGPATGAASPLLALLAAALAVALSSAPAAQEAPPDTADATDKVDALFAWATPATPGCAVAVEKDGVVLVDRAYGSADLERGVPLTPGTVFDAGSLVKQFVAATVLLLVEEGRLALTDNVRDVLPELPDPGPTITVDHLLTHTSGVRDWTGLQRLSREDADALTLVLRQRGLNFAPGEEWSYSNSGYVLLKELVGRVAGAPFSEVARQRLFEPLGMASTRYADAPQDGPVAVAYQQTADGWRPGVLADAERGGGGGLLTTVGDLLIWNAALTEGRLGAFVTETLQEPARLNSGRAIGYARGLFLDDIGGARAVWHSGSAGAYKALAARFPAHGLSLALLCNAGDTRSPMAFAGPIRELFIPAEAVEGAPPPEGTDGEDAEWSGWAGLFFSETAGEPLRLVVQRGQLRVDGGPALLPMARGRLRAAEALLTFQSEDRVELHAVSPDAFDLVSSEGRATRYRRARPFAPTAAERAAFAGRYESDELRATLDIAASADGLTVSLNGSRPFDLTPVHRDTYQLGRMTLRVLRDESGAVAGLDYSNPVLRHIAFTRRTDDPGAQ